MSTPSHIIHGIDTQALRGAIDAIRDDSANGQTHWQVTSHWKGGTRSDSKVEAFHIGGQRVAREFTIPIDEPLELCGTNRFANPQEYLLSALNACMIVGYSALCALEGIELDELRIETEGDIDLRGFLGLDPAVKPGYEGLRYTVHLRGNGTPEQFEAIHRTVMATSPNYFNVATAIPLRSRLVIGTPSETAAA
ncbi:OsmC family protein [soil metagenome]